MTADTVVLAIAAGFTVALLWIFCGIVVGAIYRAIATQVRRLFDAWAMADSARDPVE